MVLGGKRTNRPRWDAFLPFAGTCVDDEVAPEPDMAAGRITWADETSSKTLFDHLVDLRQQHLRHGDAERLGGLEVDDELEPRRLLDRQIGWSSTL
jgi:hypothetical protein